jgi:hypothetical protein
MGPLYYDDDAIWNLDLCKTVLLTTGDNAAKKESQPTVPMPGEVQVLALTEDDVQIRKASCKAETYVITGVVHQLDPRDWIMPIDPPDWLMLGGPPEMVANVGKLVEMGIIPEKAEQTFRARKYSVKSAIQE